MSKSFRYPPPIITEPLRYFALFVSKLLWRIEYHGLENIPQDSSKGFIIAANHQTYLDPFWICIPIKRKYRFMAWEKAFEWFFVGRLIRYFGAFPVNIERATKESFKQAIETLRDGAVLVIFPEGTRELSDGKLLPFKPGVIRIAMKAGAPILPVTIQGANKVWARNHKLPRLWGKIKVFYHPIFHVPSTNENYEELASQLQRIIEQTPNSK
ncbi:MAG: 1-acyl-sn-glycerol-3-phosphate acyltransferase [Acidobacteria bacterium]|jgi:1-acyl-sn-glycerol-3-phosphate acyltransferase|nr:MAG: 1-acyl-sn-glycerol-3-phosphate acyltransferase [Acidobacteriota bacterium]GIU82271.1 MAG: 1-acyl-sn-glycerol-3-phosphate acyltransferase [Pyrinomonadaceae bacterium]